MLNQLYVNDLICMWMKNLQSLRRMITRNRFEEEAKGNSEMANSSDKIDKKILIYGRT